MAKSDRNKMKKVRRKMSHGEYLLENKEIILKKRKKKKVKNRITFLFVLLVGVGVYISLDQEIFNIKKISITGNRIVKGSEIKLLSKIKIGDNIFLVKDKEIREGISMNGYVKDVTVKRKLPNEIVVNITERKGEYFQKVGEMFFIFDETGVVLESKKALYDLELFQVDGIELKNVELGKLIKDGDIRKRDFLEEFAVLMKKNNSGVEFTRADIRDMNEVVLYVNDFEFRIGDLTDMKNKLNKALNIYVEKELADSKGYIDVGFKGEPVLFIQPTVEKNAVEDEGETESEE